jgi:hypothetical protein
MNIQKQINQQINQQINKKHEKYYSILEAVLRSIDIDTDNISRNDCIKNINIFRRKLANDLIQKKLYKSLPNSIKFEKNNIHTTLISNYEYDENIYKYISFYIELNIIIIKDNKYRFVNEYNKNIHSIILLENNNKFRPIYIIDNNNVLYIFDNKIVNEIISELIHDIRIIFNNKTEITEDEIKQVNRLKNLNLNELKDICISYNIDLHYYKNDKKINRKKSELFEELKIKLLDKK